MISNEFKAIQSMLQVIQNYTPAIDAEKILWQHAAPKEEIILK